MGKKTRVEPMLILEGRELYERASGAAVKGFIRVHSDGDFDSIEERRAAPEWTRPFQRRDLTEIFPG